MEEKTAYDKWGKKRKFIKLKCDYCGDDFWKYKHQITEHNYCSLKCAHEGSKKKEIVQCAYCGEDIERTKSALKRSKSGLYFCSRECKEEAQKLGGIKEIQPDHYGKGYRSIAKQYHEQECIICGFNKIVEVHHIDENHENNDPSNLIFLCPNHHRMYHSNKYKDEIKQHIDKYVANDQTKTGV